MSCKLAINASFGEQTWAACGEQLDPLMAKSRCSRVPHYLPQVCQAKHLQDAETTVQERWSREKSLAGKACRGFEWEHRPVLIVPAVFWGPACSQWCTLRSKATSRNSEGSRTRREARNGCHFAVLHGLGLECQVCCFILAIPSPHTASGDLENRIYELQLQLREGRLGESVQHVEASGSWGLHVGSWSSWMCGFMLPFFCRRNAR